MQHRTNLAPSATNSTLLRPILFTVYQATNVAIEHITMINGPEWINFVSITEFIDISTDALTRDRSMKGKTFYTMVSTLVLSQPQVTLQRIPMAGIYIAATTLLSLTQISTTAMIVFH